MSSNSDNQKQRRLNGDRNSKRNGCRDDGYRSAGERSLVRKSCNNSQEHLKSSEKCRNTPTRAKEQSVQRMAKPAVCTKRNHFQTVCTSKDKAQSRNTSRLDENKIYDDKSSAGYEKHTFSLRTKQSSKNQTLFKSNQGDVSVWVDAVLVRYPAVLQFFKTTWFFVFYHFGKFRCAVCGI